MGEADQRPTFPATEQDKPAYTVRNLHENISAIHEMTSQFNRELFVIRLKYYQKLHNKFGSNPEIQPGDLVSITDMINQCKNYSLGIVQKLVDSSDGEARDALVLTMRPTGRTRNPYNPSVRPQLFKRNVESLLLLARRQKDGSHGEVILDEGLAQASPQLQTPPSGTKKHGNSKEKVENLNSYCQH